MATALCLVPWHLARQRAVAQAMSGPTPLASPTLDEIAEAPLGLLVANAPAIFFVLDPQGVITLSEGRQLERLGLKPGQMVGASAPEVYADNQVTVDQLRAVLAGEARHWVAKVGEHFLDTHALPVRDRGGSLSGVIGIAVDITEHKLTEAALQASETKFSLAFSASPDAFVISTIEHGRILDVNPGFERITGWTRDEIVGRTSEDIRLWVDAEQRRNLFEKELPHGPVRQVEMKFRHRDGNLLTCLFSLEVFTFEGQPCAVSVVQDITARKQAEQALRRSEQRFVTAFRASPDAISITRWPDGQILDVNLGFVEITGYAMAEAVGRTTRDLNLWADWEERRRVLDEIAEQGSVRGAEMTLRRQDGVSRRCRVSAERVNIAGEPSLLAVLHDITEQKAAEEAVKASEEKFATAFRSSPDAILITSLPDGRILEVNEGFSRISGYSREEALGSTTRKLELWAFEEQRLRMLAQIQESGQIREYQADIKARDGKIRICLLSAETVDVQGDPCLLSVVRDVTERRQAEQALRLSEARLVTAFRASPDAILISRMPSGELLEVNDSFCRLTGLSRSEALGHTILELGLWKDAAASKELMERLEKQRRIRHLETYFYSSDGTYHPAMAEIEIVEIEGDSALLSVVRDVTDLRRIETSRRRLSRMLEAISDFVAIADLEGNLIYLNEGGRRMVGLALEADVSSFHLADFHLPEEVQWLRHNVLPEIEKLGIWSGETVILRRDGRRVPALQVVTHHAGSDPEDEPFLSSIAHDITERKRMEEALVASEERFAKAFHATPDAILLASMPLGSILEANQGFSRLTGYGRREVVGRSTSQLGIWQDPESRREMMDRLSRAGTVKNFEVAIRTRDGDVRTCMLTGEVVELGVRPCLLLLLRDVTEKRLAEAERNAFVEELENKNAELERFTYTVSHDLKSPLVTIKGFLGLLRRDIDASAIKRAHRDIDRIQRAADTMGMLLDELLELSRVGRVVHPAEDVDLADLTREVVELLTGILAGRHVRLDISEDLPVVFGDRPRLREVMQNLLDNAIKFLGDGNPSPHIEVVCEQRGDDQVILVRDNGVGIDPRYHQKIFDLFDRLDPTIEGTGIGLALVKRIVEFHQGRVWVESEGPGKGSAFCFTLGARPNTEESGIASQNGAGGASPTAAT